jgi:hypothetical protein
MTTAATVTAAVLLLGAAALAAVGWRGTGGSRRRLVAVAAMAGLLAVVAALVLWDGHRAGWGAAAEAMLVLFGVLAVAGGGPVAVAVLSLADGRAAGRTDSPAEVLEDGEVLRGGAWIGSLERVGIFATLAAGWPEGVAIVLAVKGVGRYQELGEVGAAERFIIGTFASVLWAAACAGLWWFGWVPAGGLPAAVGVGDEFS